MLYLAIVSILWAFSFGLIGNALAGLDPFFVAAARLGAALVVFLPALRIGEVAAPDRFRLVGCGAVQFGLMYLCYIWAFDYLPSHLVALFSITTPIYVVLIHDLRHRRWTAKPFTAALLSVAGAAFIRLKGGPDSGVWTGFALMQIAGLAFAFGQVYYRDWKRANPASRDAAVFGWLYLGGFALALVVSLLRGSWAGLQVSPSQWGVLLYLGLVASGLGFFLWNKGAARSRPGTLAAFNNAVVPLAMAASLFVFGEIEAITPEEIARFAAGAGLIGFAVWLGNRPAKRG